MPILPRIRSRDSVGEKLTTSLEMTASSKGVQAKWKTNSAAIRSLEHLKKNDPIVNHFCQSELELETGNQLAIYLTELWVKEQFCDCQSASESGMVCQCKKLGIYPLLSAYLNESAFRAVEKTAKSWSRLKSYTWDYWFSKVQEVINTPTEISSILDNFLKLTRESDNSVAMEAYFKKAFKFKILAELEKFGISRASDWRLLYMIKESQLRESLAKKGCSSDEVERRMFAWEHFKTVYKDNWVNNPNRPHGDRWATPQTEYYAEAARYYNDEKDLLEAPLAAFSDRSRTAKEIEIWMKESVEALRDGAFFDELSIGNPYGLDKVAANTAYREDCSPNDRSSCLQDFEPILSEALDKLNGRFQQAIARGEKPDYTVKILPLRYAMGLSQQDVGKNFSVHQSQISRRESEYIEILLSLFCQLIAQKAGISLESVDRNLEEWLLRRDRHPDLSPIIQKLLEIPLAKPVVKTDKAILEKHYVKGKSIAQIASQGKLTVSEVESAIASAKQPLQRVLCIGLLLEKCTVTLLTSAYRASISSPDSLSEKILEAVGCLTEEQQKIVRYTYGARLSVSEVSKRLNCTSESVETHLAEALSQLQIDLHLKFAEFVTDTVKNWLKRHYQALVIPGFQEEYGEEYEILKLYYGERLKPQKIANRLSIGYQMSVDEVEAQLEKGERRLQEGIRSWCERKLEISLDDRELDKILKKWF